MSPPGRGGGKLRRELGKERAGYLIVFFGPRRPAIKKPLTQVSGYIVNIKQTAIALPTRT